MRIVRPLIASMLIVGLSTPALAGDLTADIARQAEQAAQPGSGPMPRGYLWTGTALFVGGMTVGLFGFLNNQNGKFPEFGEAEATNKGLGTAGLVAAFAGGTILFLGSRRANRAPAITFGPGRITVSKQLSW